MEINKVKYCFSSFTSTSRSKIKKKLIPWIKLYITSFYYKIQLTITFHSIASQNKCSMFGYWEKIAITIYLNRRLKVNEKYILTSINGSLKINFVN